jgi:caffeoyl-CoA O-methyltransferase
MLDFPEGIDEYAVAHTTVPDRVFDDIAVDVQATGAAGMMSGRTVGYFLNTLITISDAKRVLEVGTFVGYSALMMASALPEDGEVITCDVSEEFTAIARKHWARHPAGGKIDLRLAPAMETLDALSPPFDLVFIDADKKNYPSYYEKALALLAPRGLIVVDNVLWGGRVLGPDDPDDELEENATKSIKTLNEIVQNDERVVNVMLTVRDGMMLIRKKDAHRT